MSTESVALITGATVGIAGVAAGVITSVLDRKHQRRSAREARLYERRADNYLKLLRSLHEVNRDVQGANPVAEAEMDPAARERNALLKVSTEEERTGAWKRRVAERIELRAAGAAFGSSALQALVDDFYDGEERFTALWASNDVGRLDEAASQCARALRAIEKQVRLDLGDRDGDR